MILFFEYAIECFVNPRMYGTRGEASLARARADFTILRLTACNRGKIIMK
jgi:hypothetical protein